MIRAILLKYPGRKAANATGLILFALLVATCVVRAIVPARAAYETEGVRLAIKRPAPVESEEVSQTGAEAAPMATTTKEALEQLLREHLCLAQAMYYEARSEGPAGQRAVAEVILRRLIGGQHGGSICEVVFEGKSRRQCQFSFACDGSMDKPMDTAEWQKTQILAAYLLTGQWLASDATGGATNYHATYVRPGWAKRLERVTQIGKHVFYRDRAHFPALAVNGLRESVE